MSFQMNHHWNMNDRGRSKKIGVLPRDKCRSMTLNDGFDHRFFMLDDKLVMVKIDIL